MKNEINQYMKDNNIDYIFLSANRNAHPVLNYLLPQIHMFTIKLVLRRNDKPVILYNDLERDAAVETGFEMINYKSLSQFGFLSDIKNPVDRMANQYMAIFNAVKAKGRVMFSIIGDAVFYSNVLKKLPLLCPNLKIVLQDVTSVFSKIRRTKENYEIQAIRQAGIKTCQVFQATENYLQSLHEDDGKVVDAKGQVITIGIVKQFIDIESAKRGLEPGNDTIFSMGRDAGVPHNTGNLNEQLQTGKTIVFDYFPKDKASGYYFDMTRSYCLNYASDYIIKAYNDIKKVVEKVQREINVGEPIKNYQNITCDLFENEGYPTIRSNPGTTKGFTHSLGHGVGVEVHEEPAIISNTSQTIEKGMVFTIEPGLYFADEEWGLRIEDIVAIQHDGTVEKLTKHPYNLILKLS